MQDPRHRNRTFPRTDIAAYLTSYADTLHSALAGMDMVALDSARATIEAAGTSGGRVYSIGNGGSAAIADHLCCDWTKGTHASGHPVIHAQSMTANMALYSAVANDFGFDHVFAHQIELVGRAGDVLVAISSSGNSANIRNAITVAKKVGMTTIGLCGFDGGALKAEADIVLHVDIANYGVVEDAHQALVHVLAQYIACRRDEAAP